MTDTISAPPATTYAGAISELDSALFTIAKMKADWALLNIKLNEYATEEGWCQDYDDRLTEWNDLFQLLKLKGRREKFLVDTKVTLTFNVQVEVSAIDEVAATDAVNDMDNSDITHHIYEVGEYDDIEWETTRARKDRA